MKRISHYPNVSAFVRRAALVGLLVLAAACTRDRMEEVLPPEPGQPEQVEVKIHLRTSQPASPTRALSVEQESLINDVYVFFFNTTDNRVYTVVKGKNVTPTVSEPEKWTFTASLIVNTGTRTTFDCLVLTNIDAWMQGKNLTDFNGKSYDELQTILVSNELSPEALPASSPTEGLVMWGKATSPVSVPADAASITVPAIRALASVEVGVGKGPTIDNLTIWPGWNGKDASGKDIPFVLK